MCPHSAPFETGSLYALRVTLAAARGANLGPVSRDIAVNVRSACQAFPEGRFMKHYVVISADCHAGPPLTCMDTRKT